MVGILEGKECTAFWDQAWIWNYYKAQMHLLTFCVWHNYYKWYRGHDRLIEFIAQLAKMLACKYHQSTLWLLTF